MFIKMSEVNVLVEVVYNQTCLLTVSHVAM